MSDPNSTIEYRGINGFPGYRIGSDGSVWSCLKRVGKRLFLPGTRWKRLKPGTSGPHRGYRKVTLRRDGKNHERHVHALVLEHFIGPCPDGMECRHLNGVPHDNRSSNLQWSTHQVNIGDKVHHGTSPVGEKNSQAKITEGTVRSIREDYAQGGTSYAKLGRKYGLHAVTVGSIVNRNRWKHVV